MLGLTKRAKKLIDPGSKAVCLDVSFDTEKGENSWRHIMASQYMTTLHNTTLLNLMLA